MAIRCSRFRSGQSLEEPRTSTEVNKVAANRSIQSSCGQQISAGFNRLWSAVRDQGVGGLNPLSPTIFKIRNLRAFSPDTVSRPWAFVRIAVLDSRATSGEEEVDDNDQKDQAEAAAAVVPDPRSHVVAATTKQQQQDYQNDYEHRGSLPCPLLESLTMVHAAVMAGRAS